VRIGLLDGWLSSRYIPFWEAFLQALEVEIVRPEWADLRLPMPPPIRRVVGQAFSLKEKGVDFLLLPDAQLGIENCRGSPSPWMADLETTLGRLVPGLPPALLVPAELSPEVAGLAARIGQNLTGNPMLARRALQRARRLLNITFKPANQPGTHRIGLVAQPMLLDDPDWLADLRALLAERGLSLFLADKAPAELRQEGAGLELGLELPTDLEAAGMHRYLSRLGRVKGLLYVHDLEYLPLPTPLRKLLKKSEPTKPWRLVGLEAHWGEVAEGLGKDLGA
jgi:hypothetical protein